MSGGLWVWFRDLFAEPVRDKSRPRDEFKRGFDTGERLTTTIWVKKRIDTDGDAPDDVLDGCMTRAWGNQGGFDCNDRP